MNTLAPIAAGLALCLCQAACCQSVALTGMMGSKALLIVDSNPPKSLAVGESFKGVKLISTQGDQAVVEIEGKKHSLRIGEQPTSVGSGGDAAGGNRIVLSAGSGGHFLTLGQINGRSVQLMVDTGASVVSVGSADAERMGLKYKGGAMGQVSTANGLVPAWRTQLSSVRVGEVTVYNVDALVSAGSMPYVLLGNSFLSRFQMTRNNDQMVLEKRY